MIGASFDSTNTPLHDLLGRADYTLERKGLAEGSKGSSIPTDGEGGFAARGTMTDAPGIRELRSHMAVQGTTAARPEAKHALRRRRRRKS